MILQEYKEIPSILLLSNGVGHNILNVDEKLFYYTLSVLRDEVPEPVDISIDKWRELIEALNFQGITMFFYWKIRNLSKNLQPPEKIIEGMKNSYMGSLLNSLREEKQLIDLLYEFDIAKIKFLILKGTAFRRCLYPDPGTRASADIDFLVLENDMEPARNILDKLGYKCNKKVFNGLKDIEIEEAFFHKDLTKFYFSIDFHWDLHAFPGVIDKVSTKDYFNRAIDVKINNLNFKTLNYVDALIHSIIHGVMIHNKEVRLIWVSDICLLAKKMDFMQWQEFKSKIHNLGIRIAVKHAFKIAEIFMGLKLSEDMFKFLFVEKPSKKEIYLWENINLRQKNILSWIKVRLPNKLGMFSGFFLIWHLLKYKFPKFRDKFLRKNPIKKYK